MSSATVRPAAHSIGSPRFLPEGSSDASAHRHAHPLLPPAASTTSLTKACYETKHATTTEREVPDEGLCKQLSWLSALSDWSLRAILPG
eukprot:658602-Amphidinium_carterae.1